MTTYFLDSSALVKRYISESGSAWVRALAAPSTGNSVIVAEIARVEVVSAISRRRREGTLSTNQVNQVISDFRTDIATQYQIVELDEILYELASLLLLVYPLRAYDAMQLASAIKAQLTFGFPPASVVFLSADEQLLDIARAEGLVTDNPNYYP